MIWRIILIWLMGNGLIHANLPRCSTVATALRASFQYDAINQLTTMIDGVGTNTFAYTSKYQAQSETDPWSNVVAYAYNQGHRSSMTVTPPAGSSWSQSYAFDSAWRMSGITSPSGTFGYQYQSGTQSLIAGLSLPNGSSIANTYDTLGRLTRTALLNPWGHILDGYTYGLDTLGLRTNMTRELGLTTNSISIGYDAIGQLTTWSGAEPTGALRHNEQLAYAYDAAGNLHLRTNDALQQTFVVDTLNQLTNVDRSGPLTITGATPVPATNLTVNGVTAQTYQPVEIKELLKPVRGTPKKPRGTFHPLLQ